ncbi:MAG: Fic family protein [Deltaproteobacteria bacterium]|jgi:Fic family protein|nr:Fic family protein [Deltaproteobacteria bacterium]
MDLKALLAEIDQNRNLLCEKFQLTPELSKSFDNHFRITNTFTSNSIEGNSLTKMQTKIMLEDGITIGGKSMTELLETVSHGEAFDLMLEIARENSLDSISENLLPFISDLHRTFYEKIDKINAGSYRKEQVIIGGSSLLPPLPEELDKYMKNFNAMFVRFKDTFHPVILAAYAHLRFVQIHPFIDGNGRTSRLLMNLVLVNQGYQIIDISKDDRDRYINTLEIANSQGYRDTAFYDFIAEQELNAQREYMRMRHIEYPGPVSPAPSSSPSGW